jgi:transposase InsO family protein
VRARGGHVAGVVFDADHGCQYTSAAFAAACTGYGVPRSTGRVGSSYDNALAESFFATLKRELAPDYRHWASEADARRNVFSLDRLLQPPPAPFGTGLPQPQRLRATPRIRYRSTDCGMKLRCPPPRGNSKVRGAPTA